ncbi:MAG TPA: M10 family metallopeptidase C-terminal domain-containing protein [Caulobacteraceae bacterium]
MAVVITGTDAGEKLVGTRDADSITGLGGDDTILGRGGDDTVLGGAGDDLLVDGRGNDRFDGGEGFDTVSFERATEAVRVDLREAGSIDIGGRPQFNDLESFILSEHADIFLGYNRALEGVRVEAGAGDDTIWGSTRGDETIGASPSDTILGGAGNDNIVGGLGADRLIGGGGGDTFFYMRPSDSARGFGLDTVVRFDGSVDLIQLGGIDANGIVGDGDQAFNLVDRFSGEAGEAIFRETDQGARFLGDTNGDGEADFVLRVLGDVTVEDFVL